MQIPMDGRKTRDKAERRLLDFFARLDASRRETLLAFAEFLVRQDAPAPDADRPLPEPRDLPRPEKESVVAAIKRLNETYYMLEDRAGLLNETSVLMTQHVMQGRDLAAVIDDLEALFARFYEEWRAEQSS